MSLTGDWESRRRKSSPQETVGPVVREARRAARASQLRRMTRALREAEEARNARIVAEDRALVAEQAAREEMRQHAKELAREIEWEAENRAMRMGLPPNPWAEPDEYLSPTEFRLRRAFGVD